jgi:predicted nucleic acid-binding protein
LGELAEEGVVPSEVLAELEAGESKDEAASRVRDSDGLIVSTPLPLDPSIAGWDLGSGETAVLNWAKSKEGYTCVLDDRAARNCARVVGLPCVGTLGVVLAAKEAGLIAAARPVLEVMRRGGFYLAGRILEVALEKIGE